MFIQINKNPLQKNTGDCAIRAVATVLNTTWDKAYVDLCIQGLRQKDLPNANSVWGSYLQEHGFKRGSYGYDDDSYARGRGRYAQRDSMGRYSSRGSYEGDSYDGMSNRGSYDDSYERGYSSHGELDKMMQDAKSEKERDLIRQLKQMKER